MTVKARFCFRQQSVKPFALFPLRSEAATVMQGYLAHEKPPPPLGPPEDPGHSPTVGSQGEAYERGTPAGWIKTTGTHAWPVRLRGGKALVGVHQVAKK